MALALAKILFFILLGACVTTPKDADIKENIAVYPWARAYHITTQKKNTLLFPTLRIPEREKDFIWGEEILSIKTFVFTKDKNLKVSKIEELKSKTVAVMRDGGDHIYLKAKGFKNLQTVTTPEQKIKLLNAGRVDAIVVPDLTFIWMCKKENLKIDSFTKLFRVQDLSVKTHMAFNKQTSPTLIKKLNSSLKKINKDGTT